MKILFNFLKPLLTYFLTPLLQSFLKPLLLVIFVFISSMTVAANATDATANTNATAKANAATNATTNDNAPKAVNTKDTGTGTSTKDINTKNTKTKDTASQAPNTDALREYRATYALYWQGMNVGSSDHELLKVGPNIYSAESVSKPFLAVLPFGNHERSQFLLEDSKLKPQRYDFKTEEKGHTIVGMVEFDWAANQIHKSIFKGAERNEPLPENALDRITYTLQLRQDLKRQNQKGPFTYTVIEPRKVKQYTFNVVGEEKINTPMGEFKTVKLEHVSDNGDRRTQIWMATEFDYLLIRLTQSRKGKVESEALLKKLQVINSKPQTHEKAQTHQRSDASGTYRAAP